MAEGRNWLVRTVVGNMPSREQFAQSRWIKPFGTRVLHSEFWRFTRRSVPRGVGIGLFVGVFFLIPGVQIIAAALFCVPVRGNIPIAAGMTFLTNPFTTPFVIIGSIEVGNLFGFRADSGAIVEMYRRQASISEWFGWLASAAAPALMIGLFIVALTSGIIGYFVAKYGWEYWIGRKWRHRTQRASPSD